MKNKLIEKALEENFRALWDKHHYLKELDRVGYCNVFEDFDVALHEAIKTRDEWWKERIKKSIPLAIAPNCPCCKEKTRLECNGWNACREEMLKLLNDKE